MPTRIVTSTFRYKRPPPKRKAVPLEGPAIVRKRGKADAVAPPQEPAPGNDHRPETSTSMDDPPKSAIVTVKRRPGRFGDVPDMTPEEHRQGGDAADALFRKIVRLATE
jgi:hypothetical protein